MLIFIFHGTLFTLFPPTFNNIRNIESCLETIEWPLRASLELYPTNDCPKFPQSLRRKVSTIMTGRRYQVNL